MQPAPTPAAEDPKFFAAMDRAIRPVQDFNLDADDAKALRDAVTALGKADPNAARAAEALIGTPAVALLARWLRLRAGYGETSEYRAFFAAHPTWPDEPILTQRLEEAIFTDGGSAAGIKAHFAKQSPRTGPGLAALASAELAEGNTERARDLARTAWRDLRIPITLETGFLERFGALLDKADHKFRLDRLLIEEPKDAGLRAERVGVVRRLIPLLAAAEQPKAVARLAVYQKAANAAELIAAQPATLEDGTPDYGLVYHRVQVLRRQGKIDESTRLLLTVPADQRALVNPDPWWEERRLHAYLALDARNPALAYDLVKAAGQLSIEPLKEQSFIAGWIALRFLKKADVGRGHFEVMVKLADGPLSAAKASYWLGRALEAEGKISAAEQSYRKAIADGPDTFHAMLSRAKLKPGPLPLELGYPAQPTAAEAAAFNDNEVVKAVVIAKKAGLDPWVTRSLTGHLARNVVKTEAEAAMVAHLAEGLGDTQQAVRIGKAAVRRGHNLAVYSYPVHPFPAYTPLRDPPETAFLLGVVRQETEFNSNTRSGPGAMGFMQVMPITARHVCSQHRIKTCEIKRLMADKAYNTMMGSAYLGDRMVEFKGSYVLTLAGYNAGPGRARQWMRAFGDPRQPDVDPIDWIERIPFTETREYVAKVLSNIQVYRARLGGGPTAMRITADLARAREDVPSGQALPSAALKPTNVSGDIFEPR